MGLAGEEIANVLALLLFWLRATRGPVIYYLLACFPLLERFLHKTKEFLPISQFSFL